MNLELLEVVLSLQKIFEINPQGMDFKLRGKEYLSLGIQSQFFDEPLCCLPVGALHWKKSLISQVNFNLSEKHCPVSMLSLKT